MNEEKLEVKIRKIFDYQRFASNARLGRLISETENRYRKSDNIVMLSEMDLEKVSAAGAVDELRSEALKDDKDGGEGE